MDLNVKLHKTFRKRKKKKNRKSSGSGPRQRALRLDIKSTNN